MLKRTDVDHKTKATALTERIQKNTAQQHLPPKTDLIERSRRHGDRRRKERYANQHPLKTKSSGHLSINVFIAHSDAASHNPTHMEFSIYRACWPMTVICDTETYYDSHEWQVPYQFAIQALDLNMSPMRQV